MKTLLLISLLLLPACVSPHITPQRMRQAEGWVKSEIVWSRTEVGRNPWADGRKIYIDLTYIEKYNLPLRSILQHEDYHNQGITEHCPNKKCLMYHGYQTDMILGTRKKSLCSKCEIKLKRIKSRRPTTLDWLKDF